MAAAILVGSNLAQLFYALLPPIDQHYVQIISSGIAAGFATKLGGIGAAGHLATIVLWAGVGAVVYIIAWSLVNAYIAVHDSLVVGTTYISARAHSRTVFWVWTASRALLRLCILLALWLLVWVGTVWYPLSSSLFTIWLHYMYMPIVWTHLVVALAGWIALCHAGVLCLRLLFFRIRLFG